MMQRTATGSYSLFVKYVNKLINIKAFKIIVT